MLKLFINSMAVETVYTDVEALDISEVVITAWEVDEDNPHFYDKRKTLYIAAVYNQEDPEAHFLVADNSIIEAAKGEAEIYAYEQYDSPLEYRNSSYEAILSIATNNLNAMDRAYHDSVGTLDGMLEED